MTRLYNQQCALAHALDLAGERWTLLIVRELLVGPRRYTDLADGLVNVPTNLLAARLRQMESNGLVRRTRLPAPASSVSVYELTELGAGLATALIELARWGMRTLPTTRAGRPFRARWLVLGLEARFEPRAAAGVDEAYEFRIDDEVVHCRIAGGAVSAQVGAAPDAAAVVVAADADTFVELAAGTITPEAAIARGASIDGDPAAIERMRAVLPSQAAVAAA